MSKSPYSPRQAIDKALDILLAKQELLEDSKDSQPNYQKAWEALKQHIKGQKELEDMELQVYPEDSNAYHDKMVVTRVYKDLQQFMEAQIPSK